MVSWYECVALCAAARRLLQEPRRSGMLPGQEVITKKGKSQKEKADHSCSSALLTAIGWAGLCTPARSIAAAADRNLVFTSRPVVPQVRCVSTQNLMAILSLVEKPNALKPSHSPPHAHPAANPDSQTCSPLWELERGFWKAKPAQPSALTRLSKRKMRPFICYSEPREGTYTVCLFSSQFLKLYIFKMLKYKLLHSGRDGLGTTHSCRTQGS